MQTFVDVFAEAPWYMAALMGLSFSNIFVELWWWYRAPKRKVPRERKWLIRAALSLVLFGILFAYYYRQIPVITYQ